MAECGEKYCLYCGEPLDWREIDGLWCRQECLDADVDAWLEGENMTDDVQTTPESEPNG